MARRPPALRRKTLMLLAAIVVFVTVVLLPSTFSLAWPPLASTETLQLVRPMAIGLTSVAVLGAMQQEMKEMMQKDVLGTYLKQFSTVFCNLFAVWLALAAIFALKQPASWL
eukprot:symbB.v1.2.023182.t1/scaffold2105.1/size89348/4